MSTDGGSPAPVRISRMWLLVPAVAFVLFSMTLRAPVTVIPPLLRRIGADLSLSEVAMGALTSVPVLCFGVLTPVASVWLRRCGINTGGVWALALIAGGAVVRSAGSTSAAFVGTGLIGAGITIGNLVAPMVIGRDFLRRSALMTGLYSAFVNLAVTASTALAVPLAQGVGWRGAAALWGILPAAVAGLAWVWVFPPGQRAVRASILLRGGADPDRARSASVPTTGAPPVARPVLRRPAVWLMAAAFCCHTFAYYAITAWLPSALADLASMDEGGAGATASVFHLTGIVGPLLVPLMFGALRWGPARVLGVISAAWLVLPLGLVVAPTWWLAWCVIGGFAQGAFFTALFTLVIQRAASVDENRQMTALIQTLGYAVAATGAVVVGWLHGLTGGWVAPFSLLSGVLVLMGVCGQAVARGGVSRRPAQANRLTRPN